MHKFVIAAAATLIAATAAPAMANSAKPAPSAPAAEQAQSKASAQNMNTKLCVNYKVTGSRLDRKKCMTRGEWISQQGFDPSVED